MKGNVLIIDDEEKLRKLLARILTLEGFVVNETADLKGGFGILHRKEIDVVLCDVKLPDGNGVNFVKEAKIKYPLIEFILLTAYGNISDGVQAIKNGSFNYITKGDDNDRIIPLLHEAVEKVLNQKKQAINIKQKGTYSFNDILGKSNQMTDAINLAKRIAPTNANILIQGETGTGKEVFANAIHSGSNRAAQPIIAVNCGAFTKELLESELFGYKTGAYTGAIKDKKGLFEIANGGTLFLDEIGELDIDLQAKLLRVLENGEFIKLGDTKITKVDVRIIAATNRDLKQLVVLKTFREDLLYRLNVFTIVIPPLRQHKEDIRILSDHFLAYYAAKINKAGMELGKDTLLLLQQYEWNGNVRELKNVMERATILCDGNFVIPENLPFEIQKQNKTTSTSLTLASVEKEHVEKVLLHTRGNKTKAAGYLGIGLTTLYRKIDEYNIDK